MKIKNLKLFERHKEIQIQTLKNRLLKIQEEILIFEDKITKNHHKIGTIENKGNYGSIIEFRALQFEIEFLKKEIELFLYNIKRLKEEEEQIKKELQNLFAQKRGVERLHEKIVAFRSKETVNKENQLAQESFLYRHHQ